MSAKVIKLPVPAFARGWVCGCGGEQWVLYANGDCLCVKCSCISAVIKVEEVGDETK